MLSKSRESYDPVLLYYFFAEKFHFTPSQVDELDSLVMEKLIFIDNVLKELQDRESKKHG